MALLKWIKFLVSNEGEVSFRCDSENNKFRSLRAGNFSSMGMVNRSIWDLLSYKK